MKRFNATVKVNLKQGVKDVRALTLKQAVGQIVDLENFDCRVGSIYDLSFEAQDEDRAREIVDTIAQEILANSVIETYEATWQDE